MCTANVGERKKKMHNVYITKTSQTHGLNLKEFNQIRPASGLCLNNLFDLGSNLGSASHFKLNFFQYWEEGKMGKWSTKLELKKDL